MSDVNLGGSGKISITSDDGTTKSEIGESGAMTSVTSDGTVYVSQTQRMTTGVPMQWMKCGRTLTHEDSGTVNLFTVPANVRLIVRRAALFVTEVWDGTGVDVDCGISGLDPDGLIDGSNSEVDFTSLGFWPETDSNQGALLHNGSHNKLLGAGAAGTVITAAVTPGSSATTGEAELWLLCSMLPV